ncbi:MAG: AAA family ATPase [Thermodesulfobacteriota bacterium]|nr:AAA family ATPase [Thermodesulfobacteriota bacterium]
MYLSHYHLKVKPFQINPDPKFLWMGESHRQVLLMFRDGIIENKGLILLVGDVGTGKTTLINKLVESLDENTLVASVQYPGYDILDFYNFLAASFNMDKKFSNKGDFLIQFIHFLHEAHTHNNRVLLIIDEAQGLSDEILDEIRLLANLERMKVKLLNIFLVGQNEMDKILIEPDNMMLAQSIAAKYYLGPLKKGEVKDYIKFRLQVAGAEYRIFNKGAIREIIESSQCYPRLINVICDHALLTGYVQGKSRIDAAVIKECAKEHQLHSADDAKQDLIENRIEKRPDESTLRARTHFHWAMPAVLLLALFLLSIAGYFAYLKSGSQALKPIIDEQIRETTAPVAVDNSPFKFKVDPDDRNTGKKRVITDAQRAFSFVEEDLGESESSDTSENGLANIENIDSEVQPALNAPEFAEQALKDPADLYPTGKLVINIPPNAKKLPEEIYSQLDEFLSTASRYPEANILIKSYTDSYGDARQNKILSKLRADVVKGYFINQGIDSTRIKAVGFGDKDPITSNATLTGRNKNRRIEIELVHE